MAIEQLMGWGLTTLAVLGFGAIGLVAIWPRWQLLRALRQVARKGFQRLSLRSAEAQRLQEPVPAGLLGLGPGCRLRAVWKTPLADTYLTTVRCHYTVPRAGGTSHKWRTFTRFLVLRPLPSDVAFTVQNRPPDNPLARMVTGMIEKHAGASPLADDDLLPAFRSRFIVRGSSPFSGAVARPGEAFQLACLDREQGGKAPLDLGRLLGEEGALAVSPRGLVLETGQNYAPRGAAELLDIVALLRSLLRCV